PVRTLWLLESRHDARLQAVRDLAASRGVSIRTASRAELDQQAEGGRHQGVVAELAGVLQQLPTDLDTLLAGLNEETPFLLVLDGLQDPHNLGPCLRGAKAPGVHAVIAPRHRAAGVTPVARNVASGAAEYTAFITLPYLARTLLQL